MGNDKFLAAIFWMLGNEIFLFKELVEPDYRGISDYPFMHADKWQEVIRGQPALKDKKYCDVPRGANDIQQKRRDLSYCYQLTTDKG